MAGKHFTEENALRLAAAGTASGTSTVNGAVQDLANFDGYVFFTVIYTANAGNFLKAQQGEVSDGSDMADLAGSKQVAVANGQVVYYDAKKGGERYVRPVVVRGAATIVGEIYAIPYHGSSEPVINAITNVLLGTRAVAPVEGTP